MHKINVPKPKYKEGDRFIYVPHPESGVETHIVEISKVGAGGFQFQLNPEDDYSLCVRYNYETKQTHGNRVYDTSHYEDDLDRDYVKLPEGL